MDTQYEDYYSQYEETHEKVNNAFDLACSHEVSRNLIENITNAAEKIGRCKIGGENDNVIASYNEVVNSYLNRLDNLYAFSASYSDVEIIYNGLLVELDELKEYDSQFKAISQQQPQKSNYEKKDENNKEYTDPQYDIDLYNWKIEVSNYKKCCKTLSDNIQNYIDYLASVNSFDPKEGQIQVSVERPSYFSGDEILEKYSNESLTSFLDDRTIESYALEGRELKKFLRENHIKNGEQAIVYKKTVMVNGIPITTYSVFDKDCSPEENKSFERYINKSLEYESKIDPAILSKVFAGKDASSVIFLQTSRFDPFEYDDSVVGYYWRHTHNITMLYPGYRFDDFSTAAIVHETGHAYDHRLYMEGNDNQSGYYSENTDWKEIISKEVNYFDCSNTCIIPGFESKEKAQEYYDSYCLNATDYEIVESDGEWSIKVSYQNPVASHGVTVVNGFTSGYVTHDYVKMPYEYFADSFMAYWLGDKESDEEGGMSRLEFLCPETYAELQKLIENDKNNYYGGK